MASNTPILDALRASVAAQAKAAGVSDINDDTGSYIDSNYQRGPLGAAYDEVASAAVRQFISQLTPEQFKAMQAEGKPSGFAGFMDKYVAPIIKVASFAPLAIGGAGAAGLLNGTALGTAANFGGAAATLPAAGAAAAPGSLAMTPALTISPELATVMGGNLGIPATAGIAGGAVDALGGMGSGALGASTAAANAVAGPGVTSPVKSAFDWLTPGTAQLAAAGLGALAVGSSLAAPGVDDAGVKQAAGQQMSIADQQLALANKFGTEAQQRQAGFDPKYAQLIDQALASQTTNDARSAQAWDQYTNLFMPAQQKLVDTAMNYDTEGRRNAAAAEAVAGTDLQLNKQREAQQRDLSRAGVSLTSGRASALDAAQRFAQAKLAAGADRAARTQVENTGIGLLNNAAGLGQQVAGTSNQFGGLALNAGQVANSGLSQQQGTYNASLLPQMQGLSNASSSTQAAGSLYGNNSQLAMQQQQQQNAGLAGLGQLAGTLLTAPSNSAAGQWFTSDKNAKNVKGKVSGKKALASLEDAKVLHWKYKPGRGDGGEHIGRMAGSVAGDPMKGKAIDVISELGLQHAAIKELARKVKELS